MNGIFYKITENELVEDIFERVSTGEEIVINNKVEYTRDTKVKKIIEDLLKRPVSLYNPFNGIYDTNRISIITIQIKKGSNGFMYQMMYNTMTEQHDYEIIGMISYKTGFDISDCAEITKSSGSVFISAQFDTPYENDDIITIYVYDNYEEEIVDDDIMPYLYEIDNENNTISILGFAQSATPMQRAHITIKSSYVINGVTYNTDSIKDAAFYGLSNIIEDLVIENGVKSIGTSAFACNYIRNEVILPDSITTLDNDGVFYNTNQVYDDMSREILQINEDGEFDTVTISTFIDLKVKLPNTLTSMIGTFDNANIRQISLPQTLTYIGRSTFNCAALTSLILPSNLTEIDDNAFSYCPIEGVLTIPDSVTTLGIGGVFSNTNISSVIIPDSITEIPSNCFSGCKELVSVDGLDHIAIISDCAFCDCESLSTSELPECLTELGYMSFYNTGITSLSIKSKITEIPQKAFESSKLSSVTFDTDTITSMGEYAFRDTLLTSVEIPKNVLLAGGEFYGCHNLTTVDMYYSDDINDIVFNAFENCNNLTTLNFHGTREQYAYLIEQQSPDDLDAYLPDVFKIDNVHYITD